MTVYVTCHGHTLRIQMVPLVFVFPVITQEDTKISNKHHNKEMP